MRIKMITTNIYELFTSLKTNITDTFIKNELKANLNYLDTLDSEGYNLLHYAVREGEEQIVKLLLEEGANVNLKTKPNGDISPKGRTALELILLKINSLNEDTEQSKLQLTQLMSIKDILLDYGANRKAIGKDKQLQQQIEIIKEKLSINDTIIKDFKKNTINERLIKECGEGNKDLGNIYEDFYKFLQSRLNSTIIGLKAASSEILATNSENTIDQTIKKILEQVPGIGKVLGEVYQFYADGKQLQNFKHKVAHFISNKHTDEVVADYSARMVKYYKEEVIKEDIDLSFIENARKKIEDIGNNAITTAQYLALSVVAYSTALPKHQIIDKYKKEGNKILEPHWENLAAKCIVKFLEFLKNHEVDYQADLGIRAANSIIPKWISESLIIDTKSEGFSIYNAYSLGVISHFLYESKEQVKSLSKKWGYELYIKQSDYFQSLIMADKEKIIVAFRGTFHDINWLSNINAFTSDITVGEKTIKLHRGFYEALMTQWNKNNLSNNEIGLKEKLIEYLDKYKEAKIYITGHSLGGAMASVGYCQVYHLLREKIQETSLATKITLYTYGQPAWCTSSSVGEAASLFKSNYHRIVNYLDLVPKVPPELIGYKHLGTQYYLHKDGTLLEEGKFSNFTKEVDEQGYYRIATGVPGSLASVLYINNHYMDNYIKQLSTVKQSMTIQSEDIKKQSLPNIDLSEPDIIVDMTQQSQKIYSSLFPLSAKGKELLKEENYKNDINFRDVHGLSLLHISAAEGDEELVKYLLANKADIEAKDVNGRTALSLAASNNHISIAEILIEKGSDTNFKVWPKTQPLLCWAAEDGHTKIIQSLIAKGTEVNIRDNDGYSPIYWTAKRGYVKAAKLLIENNSSIDEQYDWGVTALQKAAENGYLRIVQLLIKSGANVNIRDSYNNTALSRATQEGHLQVVEQLIATGAEYTSQDYSNMDEQENSLLHLSGIKGLENLYLYIVDKFQDQVSRKNKEGKNIEELALEHDRIKILEDIWHSRKNGESIYDQNNYHKLAKDQKIKELSRIHKSVGQNISIEEARKGININKVNEKGNTLLYELIVKECSNENDSGQKSKDIERIINYEVDIGYTERLNGWTPLHLAVSSNQEAIVELLVKKGANIWQTDKLGRTPLDLAIINGYEKLIKNPTFIEHVLKNNHQKIDDLIGVETLSTINSEKGREYIHKFAILHAIHLKAHNNKNSDVYLIRWKQDLLVRLNGEIKLTKQEKEAVENIYEKIKDSQFPNLKLENFADSFVAREEASSQGSIYEEEFISTLSQQEEEAPSHYNVSNSAPNNYPSDYTYPIPTSTQEKGINTEKNADNQRSDPEYLYQAADVRVIQKKIMLEYQNNFIIHQPIGDNESIDNTLKELIQSLQSDKPTLCVYNIGDWHWVIFAALKESNNKTTILYKDSRGEYNKSLKEKIENIVNDSITFISNSNKEQTEGLDCGIFALQNMKIIAQQLSSNKKVFIDSFQDFTEFCSLKQARDLRSTEFAEKYKLGIENEGLQADVELQLLKEVRQQHQGEIEKLSELLKKQAFLATFESPICVKALNSDGTIDMNKAKSTIAIEIGTNGINHSSNYHYRIYWSKDLQEHSKSLSEQVQNVLGLNAEDYTMKGNVIMIDHSKLPMCASSENLFNTINLDKIEFNSNEKRTRGNDEVDKTSNKRLEIFVDSRVINHTLESSNAKNKNEKSVIENQDREAVIVNVMTDIIHDNELLNYPELLKEPLKVFTLNQILDLSEHLNQALITEAITNNDSCLVLGALMSLSGEDSYG